MLNIESLILAAGVTDISLDDRTSPPAPPPSLCGPRSIYTFTHLGFVSALTSDSKFETAEMLPRRSGGSCATDDKSLRLWTACDCTPLYEHGATVLQCTCRITTVLYCTCRLRTTCDRRLLCRIPLSSWEFWPENSATRLTFPEWRVRCTGSLLYCWLGSCTAVLQAGVLYPYRHVLNLVQFLKCTIKY